MAAEHGATIHVLYAVEPVRLGGYTTGAKPASAEHEKIVERQRAEGQAAIDEVVELATEKGVDVFERIEYGEPDEEILEYAETEGIDAIVMGTHGRTGAGRLVIGSVAEKVVRRSPIPVVTIRREK